MHYVLELLSSFNSLSVLFRLLLAALLGGAIGWERGLHGHIAGLRTHILVCIGAATAMLAGMYCHYALGSGSDLTRIGAQVVSGIGFLGAGTILIRDRELSLVTGVTTAAGLWATGTIGLAVGAGFYWGALICTAIALLTMTLLPNMEKNQKQSSCYTKLYMELQTPSDIGSVEHSLREWDIPFENLIVCPPHSGIPGHLGMEVTIRVCDRELYLEKLRAMECISFAVTS